MHWDFMPGDRVELLHSAGTPTLKFKSGEYATVMRASTRQGRRRYLIRFDRMDEFYGLYWLGPENLARAGDQVALKRSS